MTENFPNLVKEINTQVHEVQRVSNQMNPKRPKPRLIKLKCKRLKTKRESEKQQEKSSQLPTRKHP